MMLLHFVVLSTENSECLIGGNALPVVCGTMPFLKAIPWPLVISLFAVTQAVLALCHVRRNTQADFVPCGLLHSGPAAEYCLVGEVTTNGVLGGGCLLWFCATGNNCSGHSSLSCTPWGGKGFAHHVQLVWVLSSDRKDTVWVKWKNKLWPWTPCSLWL